MSTEPTNKDRAERASHALILYASLTRPGFRSTLLRWALRLYNRDFMYARTTYMADLLADLWHLCEHEHFDFGIISQSAKRHYLAERIEKAMNIK